MEQWHDINGTVDDGVLDAEQLQRLGINTDTVSESFSTNIVANNSINDQLTTVGAVVNDHLPQLRVEGDVVIDNNIGVYGTATLFGNVDIIGEMTYHGLSLDSLVISLEDQIRDLREENLNLAERIGRLEQNG